VKSVADPEIPRWTRVRSPYTNEDALAWVALAESMAREGSAYHLLVVEAEGGAPLGSVGLEIPRQPELHGEIGYWLAAPARGQGIATRAVHVLARWALETLSLPSVEVHVLPSNAASQAVARRAGFRPAGQRLEPFRGRVEEFDVMVLDADRAAVADRPVRGGSA
jgi:[ribosomal protein S5]-alanine N-acetyltransferase